MGLAAAFDRLKGMHNIWRNSSESDRGGGQVYINRFLYLNLRRTDYSHFQRGLLLHKAIQCLGKQAVLEVHTYAIPAVPTSPEFGVGLKLITLKDGPNHFVSQIYQSPSAKGDVHKFRQGTAFYVDGRCIGGEQVTRQAIHLLHKLHRFRPNPDSLVIWTKEVPRSLFDTIESEQRQIYVQEQKDLGLVIIIDARMIGHYHTADMRAF